MRRRKDSHRQQGPLHGAHPLYGALSKRGLLDPIKPACNQSQLDGRLRLTSSAFNRLWISMPAVLIRVATVILLQPSSTSSITARHLLDSMVHGKITEADRDNLSGRHPNLHHPTIFTPNTFSAITLPIYPGWRQVLNNANLHTSGLVHIP